MTSTLKMIVTDLDGTLLRTDKTITEYTKSVLRQCFDIDVKVVFATARPIRAVKMLDIPFANHATIYHNGAVITIGDNMFHYGISPQAIKNIVDAVFQNDPQSRLCIEINDSIFGNTDASDIWPGIVMNLTDFSDLPLMPADKIILLTADIKKIEAVNKALPPNLYLEISENTVAMIMHKNATKVNAIKRLCESFDINMNEIVAFGDDHNDVEMLRECGIGVAVANAIDEAKTASDYTCNTNDNDGVAKWIEENVL